MHLDNKYNINLIEYNPLTRSAIAGYLYSLQKNNFLTSIEKQKVYFYLKDYSDEIFSDKYTCTFFYDNRDRLRLFTYSDTSFTAFLDPIIGISKTEYATHIINGLSLFGSINHNINYQICFYDNHENSKDVLKKRSFSREQGIQEIKGGDYSNLIMGISYNWSNGFVFVGKDNPTVGSGLDGKLILSDKSPSFPFFSIDYYPTDWIYFKYFHGWLNSDLADSSTYIKLNNNTRSFNYTMEDRQKYIALHYITLIPFDYIKLSIGESVIYSDNLEMLYLVPISFFRLADHYMSRKDTGDNSQMFIDLKIQIPQFSSSAYGTLFIDELQLAKWLNNEPANKHLGYTIGTLISDLLTSNSDINIEYTHINPFVYNNFNPAQTYYSSGYQLGHWIGSNADQLHLSYRQDILYNLYFKLWFDYIRKGKKETVDEQYTFPNPSFLYGGISYYSDLGLEINYELINTLNFRMEYIRQLKSTGRFITEYGLNTKNRFAVSVSFGL